MSVTTSTQTPDAVRIFYDKVLQKRALDYLAHMLFGQFRPVDLHSGDQPKFRLYNSLTEATAPIGESTDPAAQQVSVTDISGQLETYGSFIKYSTYASLVTRDPLIAEYSELCGENMGQSMDIVCRDTLAAGTSVAYANSVAGRVNIVSKLTKADLLLTLRALRNQKAKYYVKQPIMGTDRVGTTPIGASYYAIVDPYTIHDLKSILGDDFIPLRKYSKPESALLNEVGSFENLRFIETTNAKVFADAGGTTTGAGLKYTTADSACDVHTMLIFGQDAYGITNLTGKASEIIVKPIGAGDDPMNKYGTVAWKVVADYIILNQNWMYRYEHGVSA